ncbi:MAG: hypothetical protein H0T90_03650 [Gemmatimonadales bacterium]|nr:hypothetical protein [Gemmatimonadales bacterium]
MSAQLSKITPALFPILVAALLASACSDSTAPSGDEVSGSASPGAAAPTGTPTGSGDAVASHDSGVVTPSFATRSAVWAAAGVSPGYVQVNPGAALCSGAPVGRYVKVGGMKASSAGGDIASRRQLATADVDLYRWNGSAWAYQRTLRSSLELSGITAANSLPAVTFNLAAAGYYHVMVRATWWADMGTGSWVKKASAVYAFSSQTDYSAGAGASPNPGYCTIY